MSPPWKEVEQAFHEARALPRTQRRDFLQRAYSGNPELLRDVESLLQHEDEETGRFEDAIQPVAREVFSRNQDSLAIGSALGPYRIDRKLGQGGMGSVYLATDTRLDRQVAVKIVSHDHAGTPEARARFLREARSAAALTHPNIAVLHDFGETGEIPWLVMEYITGVSLRAKLLTGPIAESTLLKYAQQIALALEHAHSRHIVHRDLKPENIVIAEDGHLKVIDFGLARAVVGEGAAPEPITQPSTFVGTLAYSAPELFSGVAASPRSDVYSAGVLFYEMACGEHPFARLNGPSLVAAILSGSCPPVRARHSSLSTGLSALIDRCMTPDPAVRYRYGGELAAELRRVVAGEPVRDAARPFLAIIDFMNIAAGSDLDWLGTGIAETLSADLAKIKSVRVVNRGRVQEAVRRFGHPLTSSSAAAEFGRELSARWIVTGGYQQIGHRVRITPKLIDPSTGDILSTEKVDGRQEDLFELQDRVVAALLGALTIRFGTTDRQKLVPAEARNMQAYEHYARGRQHMYQMQSRSLTAAIDLFEQAISVDPDYALAYSALGTAHALQFLRSSSPDDVARASIYLEKAIELDPELGEPYPWLANIRIRKNDPEGALAAGARGIELQPDLPEAHYFFAGAHYMVAECRISDLRVAPPRLLEAIRLQPGFHPAWVVLGAVSMFLGEHRSAIDVLSEAVRMESSPNLTYRFVGARTLLGMAHTRAGDPKTGRTWHTNAIESLKGADHVYAPTFRALSACGLGDIDLRGGDYNGAQTHYRHARRIIKETPRIAGSARLLIRATSGLSAAYAAAGESGRALELRDEADAQLKAVAEQVATVTFECGLSQLYLGMAVAELRLAHIDNAITNLQRAREKGWLDWRWLLIDRELLPLHGHPAFTSFVEDLQSTGPVVIQVPVTSETPGLQPSSESV
jgi:serine/threonine protein kinase/tetratricopeptide (TPR) repeat protein